MRETKRDWVVFVDDDNEPAVDWLVKAVEFLRTNPHIVGMNRGIELLFETERLAQSDPLLSRLFDDLQRDGARISTTSCVGGRAGPETGSKK